MRAAPSGSCACNRAIAAARVGSGAGWPLTATVAKQQNASDRTNAEGFGTRWDLVPTVAKACRFELSEACARSRAARHRRTSGREHAAGGGWRDAERAPKTTRQVAVAGVAEIEREAAQVALAALEPFERHAQP